MLDGDGHTYTTESGRGVGINIISASLSFLEQLKIMIESNINVNVKIYDNDGKISTSNLIITTISDTTKFLDWIYEDAGYYLNRKYQKYLDIKNKVNHTYFKLNDQIELVKKLYDEGLGTRKIAKILGVSRSAITTALKKMKIHDPTRKQARTVYLRTSYVCKNCHQHLSIDKFRKRIRGDRISYETRCFECESAKNKELCAKRYAITKLCKISNNAV